MKSRIVVLYGGPLTPELRGAIQASGALLLDIGTRDPALSVRHLVHALENPMALPIGRRPPLVDPRKEDER